MTEVLWDSPTRPRRAAAKNALYRNCPTCDRKFLPSELEFHVNLCIQKIDQKNQEAKKSPNSKPKVKKNSTSPKQPRFSVDKKVIKKNLKTNKHIFFIFLFF